MALLDGPRLAPRSGAADALVVLLHGYGADGRDLIDIGAAFADLLPGAAFVAPHAPEPCAEAPVGRQWFPLTFRDPHELARGTQAAWPTLRAFLDSELTALRLPASRLALLGFSQGAMMALHAATAQGGARPAAVVGCSGLWAELQNPPEAIDRPPPLLLVHGAQDELIPVSAMFASAQALAAAGAPVEWHMCPDLGHGIDEAGLFHAGAFLAEALGRRPRRASQE